MTVLGRRFPGRDCYSGQQEAFCIAYVCNGGNAAEAAQAAGYSHPDNQGPRQLTKPHVGARIRQLVALDITSQLGQLVTILLDIARDPLTPPRERIMAINSLLDRGGLAVPKSGNGPTVAVQVNVATDASGAQSAIREVWESREARQRALAMGGQAPELGSNEHEHSQVIENEGEASAVS